MFSSGEFKINHNNKTQKSIYIVKTAHSHISAINKYITPIKNKIINPLTCKKTFYQHFHKTTSQNYSLKTPHFL
jgi:hypothetical protein